MALILVSLVIPALVTLLRKEAKDSTNESIKSKALHLAEAGLDRGAWKMRETDTTWDDIIAGTVISGYNNDVTYSDVEGGQYRINIGSNTDDDVTIVAKGLANGEVRAISAIYTKGNRTVNALHVTGALTYKPNLEVHWGPVASFSSIEQAPSQKYPRKYSAGQIVGYDTTNDSNNGAMPGEDWVTYDYAAFYDLGFSATVNLDEYRTLAQNSIVPPLRKGTGVGAAAHDTSGGFDSGYYTADAKIRKPTAATAYTFDCSTCVIFIEGALPSFPNSAYLNIRALVVTGDVDFNAGSTAYTATIPDDASDEYQHSSLGTYFTDQGWVNGGTIAIANVGMHGFLYVGGNLTNAGGGSTLIGAVFLGGDITANAMTVYYDEAVSDAVELSGGSISRSSWDEVNLGW